MSDVAELVRQVREIIKDGIAGPDWRTGRRFFRGNTELRMIELLPKIADSLEAQIKDRPMSDTSKDCCEDLVRRLQGSVRQAAQDLIDAAFNNRKGRGVHFSIPAKPDEDTDLVLVAGIKDAADLITALQERVAKVERMNELLSENCLRCLDYDKQSADLAEALEVVRPLAIIAGSLGPAYEDTQGPGPIGHFALLVQKHLTAGDMRRARGLIAKHGGSK